MADIRRLPGSKLSFEDMIEDVRRKWKVEAGCIVVFTPEGDMHTVWKCNDQQMAMAAARLLYLAVQNQNGVG